jgi:adenylylsulfate kinase-like enzyme
VKGLYKKARAGEIADFTGISSPFEPPLKPELTIQTGDVTVVDAVDQISTFITNKITLRK